MFKDTVPIMVTTEDFPGTLLRGPEKSGEEVGRLFLECFVERSREKRRRKFRRRRKSGRGRSHGGSGSF